VNGYSRRVSEETVERLDDVLDTHTMVVNTVACLLERNGYPANVEPLPVAERVVLDE
jgi:hypothetical protein